MLRPEAATVILLSIFPKPRRGRILQEDLN
jgi:hypothetical protein